MLGWMPSPESVLAMMALKGSIVLMAAGLAARLLRRSSAAVRHLVWVAAFAGLLVLPLLTVSLPALPVTVAPGRVSSSVVFQALVLAPPATPAAALIAAAGPRTPGRSAPWRPDWRWPLLAFWLGGTLFALGHLLASWGALARARRKARVFSPAALGALGLRDPVAILETPKGSMPMAFGLVRPAVLLPADAAEWSPERRRLVLLHELAHIQRGDLATHLLGRIACCLYWWNPLTWTAWRQFLKEREHAADDRVLSSGARASDYAGHLLDIARAMHSPGPMQSAALAMARRSQLEGRLLAILDSTINRKSPGRATVAMAALVAMAVLVPFAALRAQAPAASSDVRFRSQTAGPGNTSAAEAALTPEIETTIRSATAQKNYAMLDQAAAGAQERRQFDAARTLLDSALAIRAESAGDHSVDYGMGLLKLGDLERARSRPADAEAFYSKAVDVLGPRPESASALFYLALSAIGRKDYDRALSLLDQAQVADPSRAGYALSWMGLVKERQNDLTRAEALYQQAITMQDPATVDATNTMVLYAQFLQAQGRAEESQALRDRAATLRKALVNVTFRPAQAAGPAALKVGDGTTPPALLSKVEPEYTQEARAAKYQGTVVVSAEIGADGHAHNMQIVRGLGLGLDENAMDAISQWSFRPGTNGGQPVAVMANIEVNFRLL